MWILFLLVATGAVAIFVWDYRRKARAREAASKKRFEEMFAARPGAAPSSAPAAMPATEAAAEPKAAAVPVATAPSNDRFLGKSQTLVYRLLRAGMPDHEVFANVTLAAVIGSGSELEARRLAQYRLDFVVCDKDMKVVAAIEVGAAGGAQAAGEQRFKADALKAAGIGMLRIDVAALPKREAIRALVYGRAGA